jgi:hypothetical protein
MQKRARKSAKKAKAPSAKEKARIRAFLPFVASGWFQSPKPLNRGKSNGLEKDMSQI